MENEEFFSKIVEEMIYSSALKQWKDKKMIFIFKISHTTSNEWFRNLFFKFDVVQRRHRGKIQRDFVNFV